MRYLAIPFLLMVFFNIHAQTPGNFISMNEDYSNQVYYSMDNGVTASDLGNKWEIAFSLTGEGGIFINEYAAYQVFPTVLLDANESDFNVIISNYDLYDMDTLRNPEINWQEGAFNENRNLNNPNDYGWGEKKPGKQGIFGNNVYVVAIPGITGTTYKKIIIDSLMNNGNLTFTFANLNGQNKITKSLNLNNFKDTNLVYYSLSMHKVIDGQEPKEWDIMFTRYNTPHKLESGSTLNYNITGILHNDGIEAIDLDNITYPLYEDTIGHLHKLEETINTIGYDWKEYFMATSSWYVEEDRVFFVKTLDNKIWRLVLIDYEGRDNGVIFFEKLCMGIVAVVEQENPVFATMMAYPNPVKDEVNVVYSLKQAQKEVVIKVTNMLGQCVYQTKMYGNKGLNAKMLFPDFPNGHYFLTVIADGQGVTEKIIIAKD